MNYSKIIDLLQEENILLEYNVVEDKKIEYISYNSKFIKNNTLFFCKGKNYKEKYLLEGISKGVIAYISEIKYMENTTYFIVKDIRRAMAVLATCFYDYSFKDIETIGITGTKGKTTVTYFIDNILNEYTKSKNGIISTVETYTEITDEESHLTTPEAIDLNRFFYEVKKSNLKYLTMEVTSQSYKTDRVYGVEFKHGMFLNISEDHISDAEHEDFNDYFSCKLEFLKHCEDIVLNRDTDNYEDVIEVIKDKKIVTYGKDNNSDYYYTNIVNDKGNFSFDVINEKEGYKNNFKISMKGRFNIENAVAAITMCKVLGVDDDSIKKGLIKTEVKGRMNVYDKNGITVIVDYAHNLLSFTKLYESIKLDYPNRRIISLGGAPGGKAYKRREDFALVVGDNSDYIYLTAEDPQFESVTDICNDIIKYIRSDVQYEILEDRTKAVEKMLKEAKKGDVLVLLAKGEEDYQKVKGEFTYFESDLNIVKRLLEVE